MTDGNAAAAGASDAEDVRAARGGEGADAESAVPAEAAPKPDPAQGFRDEHFRKRRKNGEFQIVTAPHAFAPLADTHAHLDMLADPGLSLARAGVHDVRFVEAIADPVEDGWQTFDQLGDWLRSAALDVRQMGSLCCGQAPYDVPRVRIAAGVHPHNASAYDDVLDALLVQRISQDARISAIGEIGLDYHYDLSPRDQQRQVFRRQLAIARQAGLPVALHIRDAHDEALARLSDVGFPEAGTLLHCCTLGPAELAPWLEAGCYVAVGGALTFKSADAVRAAALTVPLDRLLTETDAPYMTPAPLRGNPCGPEHVAFTAERLAALRGLPTDSPERRAFYDQLYRNALALLDRPRA